MDLGTIGGTVLGLGLIIGLGIGPSRIPMFIDMPSFFIVIGGSISAVLISFPLSKVKGLAGILKNVMSPQSFDTPEVIKLIVSFAEQARREGILALESRTQEIEDEFLKKGVQLAVDGTEPELIKDIMTTEIGFIEDRHKNNADMVSAIADLAPAFGMVGTLIGLVLMLANMSDPSAIGPAMAVALITTLYGAVVANLFFTPFSTKLGVYSAEEVLVKTLMLEGIMSLQSGDNPRIVEWKLSAFVDPETRLLVGDGSKEE